MGCAFKDVLQRNNVGVFDSEEEKHKNQMSSNFYWSPDGILAAQFILVKVIFPHPQSVVLKLQLQLVSLAPGEKKTFSNQPADG